MANGFLEYKDKNLPKVNAMRRAISQPDIYAVPVLGKSKVLFVSASEMNNEPASCANCIFYNWGRSCQLIGPHVKVRKIVYGEPDKAIEYWPCCGMQTFGAPNKGEPRFLATTDPSDLDLLWINAPRVGQSHGGANCGGQNGGDDCDYYMTDVDEKRSAPSGFCRVLQRTVQNGDVCSAWDDDDKLVWEKAQAIIEEQDAR